MEREHKLDVTALLQLRDMLLPLTTTADEFLNQAAQRLIDHVDAEVDLVEESGAGVGRESF